MSTASDDVSTLNKLLDIEHAAIYDLAAAGATVPAAFRATVVRHYDEHRARRDVLTQQLRALGAAPDAALPAYADPASGPGGNTDIVAVETACVQAYHAAIAVVSGAAARAICATAFIDECRHLALARAAAGQASAPEAFVAGA